LAFVKQTLVATVAGLAVGAADAATLSGVVRGPHDAAGDVGTALSSYPNKHALRNHGLLLRIRDGLSLVN
jgi:hypothetical protein